MSSLTWISRIVLCSCDYSINSAHVWHTWWRRLWRQDSDVTLQHPVGWRS